MEPTDKSPVKGQSQGPEIEFLPDADELERSPLPRVARLTLHLMLLAVVSFVLWACFSDVEKVVIAKGKLVNPAPNIVVQPLSTAIIGQIMVRPGQIVKKGDVMARLDPTFSQADETQIKTRLRSLEIQQRALQAGLDGKTGLDANSRDADTFLQASLATERQANYAAQKRKLDEGIARVRATQDTNKRDQLVLAARMKSVREIESMQEQLMAQNFGARVQLLSAQEKRLEVERDLLLAKNREQELARELAGMEAERSAFEKGWRQREMEELLGITREQSVLREQLQKAAKRHELDTVLAPADGVVLEVTKLSRGSIIKEAEPMFTLVPVGAEMEAEVQIDSVDVGYIKLGDAAHVKLDAFPFQRHGAIGATVRTISEDAFRREAASDPGMEAYYLTRIALGPVKLKNMNTRMRLLPGMTLSAEIVVGKRSVMSYLIWPLTKALNESIREP